MVGQQQHPLASELEAASRMGSALEAWFGRAGRDFPWRHWQDEYQLAIAEILLQRTQATTISGFIAGFLEKYPSGSTLASADPGELESTLRPIGMQRRRAMALRALAVSLADEPDLDWEQRPG